jgi:multidrug efflux pump
MAGATRVVRAWPVSLMVFAAVLGGIVLMFKILPASFVPEEDQGYFFVVAQVQDSASMSVTSRFTAELEQILLKDPAVQDVGTVNGFSFIDGQQNNSAAIMFGLMKPFEERKDPKLLTFETLRRLNAQFHGRRDGVAFAVNPPSIPGLGTTGGFEFYVQARGSGDPRATTEALQAFIAKARQRPGAAERQHHLPRQQPAAVRDLDRNKAEVLGVHVGDVFQAMQALFGSQVAGPVLAVQPRLVRDPAGRRRLPRQARRISARSTCARRAAPTSRSRR